MTYANVRTAHILHADNRTIHYYEPTALSKILVTPTYTTIQRASIFTVNYFSGGVSYCSNGGIEVSISLLRSTVLVQYITISIYCIDYTHTYDQQV